MKMNISEEAKLENVQYLLSKEPKSIVPAPRSQSHKDLERELLAHYKVEGDPRSNPNSEYLLEHPLGEFDWAILEDNMRLDKGQITYEQWSLRFQAHMERTVKEQSLGVFYEGGKAK